MDGFYRRYLRINLSEQTFTIEPIAEEVLTRYLGGKGLSAWLLTELNPPGVDPLAPENTLIFSTGPLGNSMGLGFLPLRGLHQVAADRGFFASPMPAERPRRN